MAMTDTATASETPDLDTLDGLAAEVDADAIGMAPDGTALADQPAPVDYLTEAAMCVDMFVSMLTGYSPQTATIWTTEKKQQVAAALAPVLEKYGVAMGALPCELVLVMVAGPALYQSAKIVAAQMRKEEAEAKALAASRTVDAATGKTVEPKPPGAPGTPETPTHAQMGLYK